MYIVVLLSVHTGKQATGFSMNSDILNYKVIVQCLGLPFPCTDTQVSHIGGKMHGLSSQYVIVFCTVMEI